MLQATKNKYTVETLKPLNILYDHEHWLTQQDVDMASGYVELIERTRSEKTPQIGDRLIYVDRYGKYYGNALIENNDEEGRTGGLPSSAAPDNLYNRTSYNTLVISIFVIRPSSCAPGSDCYKTFMQDGSPGLLQALRSGSVADDVIRHGPYSAIGRSGNLYSCTCFNTVRHKPLPPPLSLSIFPLVLT